MFKRFTVGTGAVLGLVALALGGSALAGASPSTTHANKASVVSTSAAEPKATGPDRDNVQSGDQTTPDTAKASKASTSESTSPESSTSESTAPESATSESSAPSDGPGGHADPAGNVDNQQQGQN